jgi:hypothetical protein
MDPDDIVDWDELQTKYKALRDALEPFVLPTDAELVSYKLRKLRGRPQNTGLALAFDLGARTYPGSNRRRNRIYEFNEDLRLGALRAFQSKLQFSKEGGKVIVSAQEADQTCFEVIEKSIASQTVSTAFILSWGFLCLLLGRQTELLEQEEDAAHIFNRGISSGATQDTSLQRNWYACWVSQHTGGDKEKRTKVEFELAELCKEVWQGARLAPSGFDPEWFKQLIVLGSGGEVPKDRPCEPVDLKTTYKRLGWKRLVASAQDVEADAGIPPTTISSFPGPQNYRP